MWKIGSSWAVAVSAGVGVIRPAFKDDYISVTTNAKKFITAFNQIKFKE